MWLMTGCYSNCCIEYRLPFEFFQFQVFKFQFREFDVLDVKQECEFNILFNGTY
jgi:hypothetical protein